MKLESFRRRFFELLPRYEWEGTLGRGGIGVVFRALDRELGESVAIKVLSPNLARDENALLARFKREVALNRKIKHPNVARMFDYGIAGDYPFITMELIEGEDLWTLIGSRHRFPAAEAVPIVRQIARGVAAIHRLGILHRDLKSQNVLVDRHGAAVILDFGLARGSFDPGLTLASVLLGTPEYMSPEQALGDPLDERADLYSIGVIAWEMLSGQLPFSGESPVATAMKHVHDIMDMGYRNLTIITNGRALASESLSEKIIRNAYSVIVSINAASEPTHTRVMRPKEPFFDQLVSSIQRLQKLKSDFNRFDFRINANFCGLLESMHEIPQAIERFRSFGFDTLSITFDHRHFPYHFQQNPTVAHALSKEIDSALERVGPETAKLVRVAHYGLFDLKTPHG